jgi:cation transport regulator
MPYDSIQELPEKVRSVLPEHAQNIYKEVYNSAHAQYTYPEDHAADASREETAARVAWSTDKEKYEKNDDGTWHEK